MIIHRTDRPWGAEAGEMSTMRGLGCSGLFCSFAKLREFSIPYLRYRKALFNQLYD
jgi:hypothetical protein